MLVRDTSGQVKSWAVTLTYSWASEKLSCCSLWAASAGSLILWLLPVLSLVTSAYFLSSSYQIFFFSLHFSLPVVSLYLLLYKVLLIRICSLKFSALTPVSVATMVLPTSSHVCPNQYFSFSTFPGSVLTHLILGFLSLFQKKVLETSMPLGLYDSCSGFPSVLGRNMAIYLWKKIVWLISSNMVKWNQFQFE